jgi:hypothetical protein
LILIDPSSALCARHEPRLERRDISPMTSRARSSTVALRRVFENAVILIFASLMVMSIVLERYPGALVWCGALLVFFVHAWEGRVTPTSGRAATASAGPGGALAHHFNLLRWIGLLLSVTGVATLGL